MKKYIQDYLKLLQFAKPFRGLLVLAALCMGVSTLFNTVNLMMIVPVSDRIMTNKEIIIPGKHPAFLAEIISQLNGISPIALLKYLIVFIVVLFFLKGVFQFLQSYLMNMVGQGVVRDVRNKLYAQFHELSLDFYSQKRTGELMSRITNDVALITHAISYALTDLISQSMYIVVLASMALYLGARIFWGWSFLVFLIFPMIMFPVVRIGKRIKKFTSEIQKRMADLNSLLTETIQGAYIVKVFNREDYELDRFKKINQHYYKFSLKSLKRTIIISPLTEFIGVLGAVYILWVMGQQVILGKLSYGTFGLFLASVLTMISPMKKLANVHAIIQQALSASSRIYDILEKKPAIQQKPKARPIATLTEKITFKDISFKYGEAEGYVLRDLNLNVRKGDIVALVGHSGAGKSTLVSLLPRLYDPQVGSVSIDGVDVRDLNLKDLRSLLAVVSQDMVLFNATVKDNIAYGRIDATHDEIVEAARKAHALEFIQEMPDTFNTIIGDHGFRLSGGQKQRFAIARAILKDAPILILDEATSQLDTASEKLIQEAFYNLIAGKTAFVIAHRLSTVQQATKIVVMEHGKIIEEGSHDELLALQKVYKKLYDLQFNV